MTTTSDFEKKHPRAPIGEFTAKSYGEPEGSVTLQPRVRQAPPIERMRLEQISPALSFYTDHREELELNPPYQRGSVWSNAQKEDLVRSLLHGIPIGSITLNFLGWDKEATYNVVDGKQRIEAIRSFVDDELEVPRDWFDDADLEGVNHQRDTIVFTDLSRVGRRRFDKLIVPHLKSEVRSAAEEAEIFRLVNGGGTPQTPSTMAAAALVESA